ncbi:hypothetical protein ACLOJK_013418 [Asimina triloba]
MGYGLRHQPSAVFGTDQNRHSSSFYHRLLNAATYPRRFGIDSFLLGNDSFNIHHLIKRAEHLLLFTDRVGVASIYAVVEPLISAHFHRIEKNIPSRLLPQPFCKKVFFCPIQEIMIKKRPIALTLSAPSLRRESKNYIFAFSFKKESSKPPPQPLFNQVKELWSFNYFSLREGPNWVLLGPIDEPHHTPLPNYVAMFRHMLTHNDCTLEEGFDINMFNANEAVAGPEVNVEVEHGWDLANEAIIIEKAITKVESVHRTVVAAIQEAATEEVAGVDIGAAGGLEVEENPKKDFSNATKDDAEEEASGVEEVDDENSSASSKEFYPYNIVVDHPGCSRRGTVCDEGLDRDVGSICHAGVSLVDDIMFDGLSVGQGVSSGAGSTPNVGWDASPEIVSQFMYKMSSFGEESG